MSKIEWTEKTWNPSTGCTKVSAGCKHCYAETMHARLQKMGVDKYKSGFSSIETHSDVLYEPWTWTKPRLVFVNSMSDLFHEKMPLGYIKRVFAIMNRTPQHTYQILTKRAERLFLLSRELHWTPNIWMGVSVENRDTMWRIDFLRSTPARVKFLSCEPLLEALPCLPLRKIDWVIVGGESGWRARPMREEWVLDIQRQCSESGIPFFFKQWGGKNKKKAGRLLQGQEYSAMPARLTA